MTRKKKKQQEPVARLRNMQCCVCRKDRGQEGVYTVKLKRMPDGKIVCFPRPLCADCLSKMET